MTKKKHKNNENKKKLKLKVKTDNFFKSFQHATKV